MLALHRDQFGAFWVGTENGGLNRLDEAGTAFVRYRLGQEADGIEPVAGTPWEIVEARDGSFWIGTMGHGLLFWDAEDRLRGRASFMRYGPPEGLPSQVFGVVADSDTDIWFSSNSGLYRFDPQRTVARKFDRRNGLRGVEFQPARLRTRNGRLLFGGTTGVVGFYPAELPFNDRPPKMTLTASSRVGRLARTATGRPTPKIELSYSDPFIEFEFAALDFVSPDKNQYRYRLVGSDPGWREADRFRRATYSNLPPGQYVFQVQAANNDGVWNRDGLAYEVTATAPPWQRWWAYLLYLTAITIAIAWYLQGQRRKQLRDAQIRTQLEHEVRDRTSELAARNEQLETLNDKLAEASVTDSLTGLRNRRYVDQFITSEVAMVQRRLREGDIEDSEEPRDSSKLLFFMMIDLDGFKLINDTYGHHVGDDVLQEVKETLLSCCRQSDVIVRWGGDEFMIIGHTSTFAGAKILAERIRESIAERHFNVGDEGVGRLSVSIGVAPFPISDDDIGMGTWEQVCGIADQAAYVAKRSGRDAWVSVRGTPELSATDLSHIAGRFGDLVAAGKLIIDTSHEGELVMRDPEPLAAAGR